MLLCTLHLCIGTWSYIHRFSLVRFVSPCLQNPYIQNNNVKDACCICVEFKGLHHYAIAVLLLLDSTAGDAFSLASRRRTFAAGPLQLF